MIVRDIMTTNVVTVEPGERLAHAAGLLHQYQIHQLPVARTVMAEEPKRPAGTTRYGALAFEGLLTSQDIDLAVALDRQASAEGVMHRPWQERQVTEVMHREAIEVTPTTSVGVAARFLLERGHQCLPVVEYGQPGQEPSMVLVGLLTRSDLLLALRNARRRNRPIPRSGS